jgi:hypothetical protein
MARFLEDNVNNDDHVQIQKRSPPKIGEKIWPDQHKFPDAKPPSVSDDSSHHYLWCAFC